MYRAALLILASFAFQTLCCSEEVNFSDENVSEAQKVEENRSKLGSAALSVLRSSNSTEKEKCKAVLAIGKIGYVQGIAELIRQINFAGPSIIITEPDIATLWPCVGALASFGVAATPSLVEAYSLEVTQDRQKLIFSAILFGKNIREAHTYALGLLAKNNDTEEKQRLDELIQKCDKILQK